ncbi:hypothetical protein K469DRAFT_84234 [Zopfia rhizophila CBS 207.26]|uniref:Uncharacterized protein n=1 Tax=Zopfia rhizophila CBS 207.26 TaxID=1314779 RepID=A0A6A6EC71_9PEZI|nr:hypothetical protein K469DRAFT_84234 [Zopfia rhizophila CBS 207.26]
MNENHSLLAGYYTASSNRPVVGHYQATKLSITRTHMLWSIITVSVTSFVIFRAAGLRDKGSAESQNPKSPTNVLSVLLPDNLRTADCHHAHPSRISTLETPKSQSSSILHIYFLRLIAHETLKQETRRNNSGRT